MSDGTSSMRYVPVHPVAVHPERRPWAELHAQLQAGEQDAWADLVATYRGMVTRWVWVAGNGGGDAELAVEEAFARLWIAFVQGKTFPALGQLLGYLRLCAGSAAQDEVRREARHAKWPELLVDTSALKIARPERASRDMAAFWALVYEALGPDLYALTVRCYVGEERPNALAAQRGVTERAMYNLLRNARNRLKSRADELRNAYESGVLS